MEKQFDSPEKGIEILDSLLAENYTFLGGNFGGTPYEEKLVYLRSDLSHGQDSRMAYYFGINDTDKTFRVFTKLKDKVL